MTIGFFEPDDLIHVSQPGLALTYLSRPDLTGSAHLLMLDAVLAPGAQHARHIHPRQEEVLYVLEGELEAWLGEEHRTLGPGSVMFIPPGVAHCAGNASSQATRVVAVTSPCIGETGHEAVPIDTTDNDRTTT